MVELRQHVLEALDKLAVTWRTTCELDRARGVWEWLFQTGGFFSMFDSRDSAQSGEIVSMK
jgi:hypothetical protein